MWTKSRSLKLTRLAIILFMIVLLLGTVMLPMLLQWYVKHGMPKDQFLPSLLLGWLCVPPAFCALLCMHKLLRNVQRRQIFIHGNIKLLRILSWCCFAAALPLLLYGFYNLVSVFFSAILAFIALLLRVAKNMFEEAVELKEENDLTV